MSHYLEQELLKNKTGYFIVYFSQISVIWHLFIYLALEILSFYELSGMAVGVGIPFTH